MRWNEKLIVGKVQALKASARNQKQTPHEITARPSTPSAASDIHKFQPLPRTPQSERPLAFFWLNKAEKQQDALNCI
jgi:hypothetical protein